MAKRSPKPTSKTPDASAGKVNKAELIRQTARKTGKTVRPRDIVAALKELGIAVTSPQVSKTLKAAGFRRKTRGKKAGSGDMTKAEHIRRTAKTLGKKFRPRDVIAALHKEGIKVSAAQVSTTLRAAGYRRRRRGKKTTAATPAAPNGLNLQALLAAKELIQKAGGVKGAEQAIQAMKKLG